MLVATMELGPQISSSRDSKRDLPLPPRYRRGNLSENTLPYVFGARRTLGLFRQFEFLPTRKVLLDLRLELVGGVSHDDLLEKVVR